MAPKCTCNRWQSVNEAEATSFVSPAVEAGSDSLDLSSCGILGPGSALPKRRDSFIENKRAIFFQLEMILPPEGIWQCWSHWL